MARDHLLLIVNTGGHRASEERAIETMLDNRNANWAEQIEQLLAGEGTSFIAVGAAHLVGPNSVQHYLVQRGSEAKR